MIFRLLLGGAVADAKIKADMAPLDRVERGLAAKALAYITTGEPETVLSSISTLCQGDVLRLGEMTWLQRKSKISHRARYFLDGEDGDLVRRYGEVLAASVLLELPVGPDEKPYSAVLADDLTVIVENPDGAVIKALPGGEDETTKASQKQLSASRKELKQVLNLQSARLYEENHTVGLISLAFVKDEKHFAQPIALKEVPKVLLSECWNDFHAMAEKGVHDPNWEKTCAW